MSAYMSLLAQRNRLLAALRPFVAAYEKGADHIGDSDLWNEQPRAVYVTLGDCRKAARIIAELESNVLARLP